MNKIPPALRKPFISGLQLAYCGKVGEVYDLPYRHYKLLVRTDRISAFDFVFNCLIPGKGEVLNQISVYRKLQLREVGLNTDLVAYNEDIDDYLPASLRGNLDIQSRSVVVEWHEDRLEVEAIVRGLLLGKAAKQYNHNRRDVFGYDLPAGLQKGGELPFPLFTPTTKAEEGHDMPISRRQCQKQFGRNVEDLSIQAFNLLATRTPSDMKFGDTKFEFARENGGGLIFVDEVGTLDSSRYLDKAALQAALANGREPEPLDKEQFRNIVRFADDLDPANEEHVKRVWEFPVPASTIKETSELYLSVRNRLMKAS